MIRVQAFQPDWISAPGDTIRDLLQERNLSSDWLVGALERPPEVVDGLLSGQAAITMPLAQKLGEVLGASTDFWIRRDSMYRETLEAAKEREQAWFAQVPFGDLVTRGWVANARTRSAQVATLLDFFDVSSLAGWSRKYEEVQQNYAFRTSPSIRLTSIGVAIWLRQGERLASTIECAPWNPDEFRRTLSSIRALTRQKNPELFIPELQQLCAMNGVALVVVQPVKGCRASGATRLLSRDRAMIVMSARHLSEDHFWFTFFHEAAHLLLHAGQKFFLDFDLLAGEAASPVYEQEANDFAANLLIPTEYVDEMIRMKIDSKTVIRFASRIGISPGIVVGQLQNRKRIEHNWLNGLKRRYQWSSDKLVLKPN